MVRPTKEQRNTSPPTEGFVPYKQNYKSYSFDLSKSDGIFDEVIERKAFRLGPTQKMPKAEELRGNKDCKLHDSYSYSTNNCVQFKDIVKDMIVKGDITLEKPAPAMVESNPFPNMHVNMVEIN